MQKMWFGPPPLVTGEPSLRIAFPSRLSPHTTITSTTTGDLLWVSMPLPLPEGSVIHAVSVYYQVSDARSYISQVRLVEVALPGHADVVHDDATDLTSTSPALYESTVRGVELPAGAAVELKLRLSFGDTGDEIRLGAIGVTYGVRRLRIVGPNGSVFAIAVSNSGEVLAKELGRIVEDREVGAT